MSTPCCSRRVPIAALAAALVTALAVPPAGAQATPAGPAERALARAAERFRSGEGFCARFHQRLEIPLLERTVSGRGELCQRRPDRFSMRFDEPEGDLVVVDGTTLWAYFPSSDPQVAFRFTAASAADGFDPYRTFLLDTGGRFEVEYRGADTLTGSTGEAGPADHVRLVPRGDLGFVAAELWIDASGRVRRVFVEDANGSKRVVELSDEAPAPPEGDARFRFTPPPGVQVVEGG